MGRQGGDGARMYCYGGVELERSVTVGWSLNESSWLGFS
jgi:hypothetical protein